MKRAGAFGLLLLSACASTADYKAKLTAVEAAIAGAETAGDFARACEREGLEHSTVACDHLCQRNFEVLASNADSKPDSVIACIWHEPPAFGRIVSASVQAIAYVEKDRVLARQAEPVFTGP